LSGNIVHITGAGECDLRADQAGDSTYNPAPPEFQSFPIFTATQVITFGPIPQKTYGDPDFNVSATASSGLPVALSVPFGNCTVTGSTVHITGAGSCQIDAVQLGDANYDQASAVSQAFLIVAASQSISFAALPAKTFGDPDFAVTATATSGLPVFLLAAGNCTVSGNVVHLTSGGSCSITAMQPGNANYQAASPVAQTFSIAQPIKLNQTITFGPLANKTYGNPDFTIAAIASSGLQVTFSATGNCTVSGNLVHITGAGSCSIVASQAGNATYNPATPVTQAFSIAKANQTITFPIIPDHIVTDPDFTITATATSGLTVNFSTSGKCTITGNLVHLTATGNCMITALQPGNANYNPAPSVKQTFQIKKR